MLVIVLGVIPVPLLLISVAVDYLNPAWFRRAIVGAAIYIVLYLARALHAVTGRTQRVTACIGLSLITCFCWTTDALDVVPHVWVPLESQVAGQNEENPDSETILFSQPYMDAPSCQALLFDSGSPGRNCSHTFGLSLRFVAAGPDGICWLSPDHVSGLSMSREALRLSQPRFYLFCHHLKESLCNR